MRGDDDIVAVKVSLRNETKKAYCVRSTAPGLCDAWVPKSRCRLSDYLPGSQFRMLQLPARMAEEKKLV